MNDAEEMRNKHNKEIDEKKMASRKNTRTRRKMKKINENVEIKQKSEHEMKEKTEMKQKLDQVTKEKTVMKLLIDQMTQEKTEMRQQTDQLTKEKTEMKQQIDQMTKEKTEMKQQIDQMTKEWTEKKQELERKIDGLFTQTVYQREKLQEWEYNASELLNELVVRTLKNRFNIISFKQINVCTLTRMHHCANNIQASCNHAYYFSLTEKAKLANPS